MPALSRCAETRATSDRVWISRRVSQRTMHANLAIAIVLIPAWAYLIGAAVAVLRFARRSRPTPRAYQQPAVSVLKPLHGPEPGLYENLRSFAEQDYPIFQMVLGVNDATDGAIPVARGLMRDLPDSDIALLIGSGGSGANQKVVNLENVLGAASHDILVFADSDMRVDRRYLAAVTAPLH